MPVKTSKKTGVSNVDIADAYKLTKVRCVWVKPAWLAGKGAV